MNSYRRCFAAVAVLLSAPCVALLVAGLLHRQWALVGAASVVPALLWYLYWLLLQQRRYSFALSFAVMAALWIPLLHQTGRRVHFVLENENLEPRSGDGSPMAFLLGMAVEQVLFIPLSAVIFVGAWHLLKAAARMSKGPKA